MSDTPRADGFPRRNCVDLMTPAELAIRDAVRVTEQAGADVRLTAAVVLLGQAQEKVADFVDGRDHKPSAESELYELREAISPGRIGKPEYYIGVAKRMREREIALKPLGPSPNEPPAAQSVPRPSLTVRLIDLLDRMQPHLRHLPDVTHTEIEELRGLLNQVTQSVDARKPAGEAKQGGRTTP